MRAQLRTYHSIPALQAHQDPNAYKQLQDAPRLKSILKGATEDSPQPSTLEEVKNAQKPRTNPVNLIFVLAQFAPKISETHFVPPRDFYDLVMRSSLTSASRARAFLWLIWWYLESDFSVEDTKRNPFGAGQYGEEEEGSGLLPIKVPPLDSLTEEQAALENVDSPEELLFGEVKRKERIAILASEPSPAMTALKRARKEKGLTSGSGHRSDDEGSDAGWWKNTDARSSTSIYEICHVIELADLIHSVTSAARHAVNFDMDGNQVKSPSPAVGRGFQPVNPSPNHPQDMRINTLLNNDDAPPEPSPILAAPPVKKGPGRGNWRRKKDKSEVASGTGRPGSGEGAHHVPLLPNNGTHGFIHESPSGARLAPATPDSGPPHSKQPLGSLGPPPWRTKAFPSHGGVGDHIPTPSYQAQKRNRGVTQHQNALINHRRQQIDYTLDRRIRRLHVRSREHREDEGAMFRAWKRIKLMPTDYDSEEEAIKIRKARDGVEKEEDARRQKEAQAVVDDVDWRNPRALLAGYARVQAEPPDVGEEAKSMARTLRQCVRRVERWQNATLPGPQVRRRVVAQAKGRVRLRRRSITRRQPSSTADDVEMANGGQPARARGSVQRQRSGAGRPSLPRDPSNPTGDTTTQAAGEDEGGGELDEEDRELLGEVDADESEDQDEDEDEEMADE